MRRSAVALRERILSKRKALGLTQEELGQKSGMSKSAISQLENGTSKSLRSANLYRLAEALGLSARNLAIGAEDPESNVEGTLNVRPAVLAPIKGRVRGGDNGFIEEEGYSTDEFVPYHGRDSEAFGLRVVGDSMHPRYKHGEYIVACPSLGCQQGNDVYVTLHDGRKMLKELGKDHGDAFDLLSINQNHKVLTIEKSKIERMSRVYGPVPADAIVHR